MQVTIVKDRETALNAAKSAIEGVDVAKPGETIKTEMAKVQVWIDDKGTDIPNWKLAIDVTVARDFKEKAIAEAAKKSKPAAPAAAAAPTAPGTPPPLPSEARSGEDGSGEGRSGEGSCDASTAAGEGCEGREEGRGVEEGPGCSRGRSERARRSRGPEGEGRCEGEARPHGTAREVARAEVRAGDPPLLPPAPPAPAPKPATPPPPAKAAGDANAPASPATPLPKAADKKEATRQLMVQTQKTRARQLLPIPPR